MKILTKISAAIMLSLSMGAHAGAIINFDGTGVDFYSSWIGDTLRIEIDAGGTLGGGWANAVEIDSIAINAPDAWSWVNASDILLNPIGTFGGAIDGTGLMAGGCQNIPPVSGKNHQCWSGVETLGDNMIFDFVFGGASVISSHIDNPQLKVRFINDEGKKVGSLLSAKVPEPSIIALFGLGLLGLGFSRQRMRS